MAKATESALDVERISERDLLFPRDEYKVDQDFDRGSVIYLYKAAKLFSRNWTSSLGWTLTAILIQFGIAMGLGNFAFPDGKPACSEGGSRNSNVCYSIHTLTEGAGSLNFLSSFILGGFLAASVGLWRLRRTSYAALCGSTRNLLINLCSIVEDENAKAVMARWALLGYELAVLKSRGLIDSKEGKNYLEMLDLLEADEWDRMIHGDRHTTVWYWIQTKANKLRMTGSIDSVAFQTICNAVTLSRDKANDLMSSVDRDHPPPYVFICAFLTNFNLLFHTLSTGILWSTWMYNHGGIEAYAHFGMWLEVLVLFLYSSIFSMLFDVCVLLHSPFGYRDIDVKHFAIGHGIRNLGMLLPNQQLPFTMGNDGIKSYGNEREMKSEVLMYSDS